MKTIVIGALFLLLSSILLVSGKNCKTGLNYCGYNLLSKGNYYDQMAAAARTGNRLNNKLFACLGGPRGEIKLIEDCSRCADGGAGRSDFCN